MMRDKIQDMLKGKSSDVWCIPREATVAEAAHRMEKRGVGTLIVVGRDHEVGMLSEHDIVSGVLACDRKPSDVLVSSIMTEVPVVGLETTVETASALAASVDANQIVVVAEGRVVGVIAAKEMTSWVSRDRALQVSDLMAYITGRAAPLSETPPMKFKEPPTSELPCAYCGAKGDEPNWDLGVALCISCALPVKIRWSPYRE